MIPDVLKGSYVADRRELHYWTRCHKCAERKTCKHACDHPGWMRFVIDGRAKVFWSGMIDQCEIDRTVREYLERDEDELPADVAVPPRQLEMVL